MSGNAPPDDEIGAPQGPADDTHPHTWENTLHKLLGGLTELLDGVGLASPRVRWRIHGMQEGLLLNRLSRLRRLNPTPQPKLCPSCGLLAGAGKTTCPHCNRPLSGPSAWWGSARRLLVGLRNEAGELSWVQLLLQIELAMFMLTVGLSILDLGLKGLVRSSGPATFYLGSFSGEAVVAGQIWRAVTTLFIHGSFLHAAFNLMALVQLGAIVESLYGRSRFITLFLVAGLGGDALGFFWRLGFNHTWVNSVGASGAIFGMLGALFVFTRLHNPGALQARDMVNRWIVMSLVFGMMPGIDNAAHVGGLVGGALLALLMGDPRQRSAAAPVWKALGYASWAVMAVCLGVGLFSAGGYYLSR